MLINFDAGPSSLPKCVLQEASEAINNFENTGLSILEIPHRGKHFHAILEELNSLTKELLQIPSNYDVIWLQGGGRYQFSMIPMNYLMPNETAGYVNSGYWSKEAINYALYYGKVRIVASSEDANYDHIPSINNIDPELAYLHITSNNTIYGTQFSKYPKSPIPLIADMSSDIFSKKIPIHQFAMIYAVAQKNIGPAGVTMAIIRNDFSSIQKRPLPPYLTYRSMVAENSLVNTPPVFAMYCSLLNLRYLNKLGMSTIEQNNLEKANALYAYIKNSSLFECLAKTDRSNMNVCLKLNDDSLTDALVDFAAQQNIVGIKGHRRIGGLRISLYNAISLKDVKQLIQVMKQFESKA